MKHDDPTRFQCAEKKLEKLCPAKQRLRFRAFLARYNYLVLDHKCCSSKAGRSSQDGSARRVYVQAGCQALKKTPALPSQLSDCCQTMTLSPIRRNICSQSLPNLSALVACPQMPITSKNGCLETSPHRSNQSMAEPTSRLPARIKPLLVWAVVGLVLICFASMNWKSVYSQLTGSTRSVASESQPTDSSAPLLPQWELGQTERQLWRLPEAVIRSMRLVVNLL